MKLIKTHECDFMKRKKYRGDACERRGIEARSEHVIAHSYFAHVPHLSAESAMNSIPASQSHLLLSLFHSLLSSYVSIRLLPLYPVQTHNGPVIARVAETHL